MIRINLILKVITNNTNKNIKNQNVTISKNLILGFNLYELIIL